MSATATPFSAAFDATQFEDIDKQNCGKFLREDMMNDVYAYDAFGVRGETVAFFLPNGTARVKPHDQHRELLTIQIMYTGGDYAGRNLQTWFNRSSLADLGKRLRSDIKKRIG